MATLPRILRKIGSAGAALAILGLASPVGAAGNPAGGFQLKAQVDRDHVSLDESVSLKISIQSEGSGRAGAPRFQAPGFEVVNEYTANYFESYYDGDTGRFGMRNNQQITKVLKPLRTGAARISGIAVEAGGKTLTAPDIVVQISAAGSGTPPPRGYGGGGLGLRGAGKQVPQGRQVIVRAEVDKDKVFKGEQIIVSYYIYRRVRTFNIRIDKFPILNGFLREDVDLPVLGQRLDSERVMLDGAAYERSLLMRYAAFPLQDGKLKIDSTTLKYNYYPNPGNGTADYDDPFMGLFNQMQPREGADRNEPLPIEVLPLPETGKPASFTGGVGDFNVTSAVDKYEVRANEAVTLTVKVEGKGNLAAIGEPKAVWPTGVELYDSKGAAKSGKGGVGQKLFEFLLIPRAPGTLVLPALEFSFFDPGKREYVVRKTEPITLRVAEPAPGSPVMAPKATTPESGVKADRVANEPAGLLPPETPTRGGTPLWQWLYRASLLAFAVLTAWVLRDLLMKTKARSEEKARHQARAYDRSWAKLRQTAQQLGTAGKSPEVIRAYERLVGLVFDAIDSAYRVEARSRPRSELRELLVGERNLAPEVWDRVSRLLEFAETVRFASSAGAISESTARQELSKWVGEGETLAQKLSVAASSAQG